MTLPVCRDALMTPEARPAWWAGTASVRAAVTAGIVSPIPRPVRVNGTASTAYGTAEPANIRPATPVPVMNMPRQAVPVGPPARALHRADVAAPGMIPATCGNAANPASSGDIPRSFWKYRFSTKSGP